MNSSVDFGTSFNNMFELPEDNPPNIIFSL